MIEYVDKVRQVVPSPVLLAGGSFGLLFFLFKRRALPTPVAIVFGRLVHYVTLPFYVLGTELGLRGNLFDKIDDHVYLGGIILAYQVNVLKTKNITAVLNLCDEYRGPQDAYARNGITQLCLPTVDLGVDNEPTFEDIRKGVIFVDEHTRRGENVLIHCRAGRGRSAAVAICWLAHRNKDRDLRSLQSELLSLRKNVRSALYSQPNILKYVDSIRIRTPST